MVLSKKEESMPPVVEFSNGTKLSIVGRITVNLANGINDSFAGDTDLFLPGTTPANKVNTLLAQSGEIKRVTLAEGESPSDLIVDSEESRGADIPKGEVVVHTG